MAKRALLGQLGDVDLRRLRVFRAVAEAGGISAAELELNIGRSTISTHIKDLEIRLGVRLCQRGRSGFALTEEGHRIYEATVRLLGSLDGFQAEVADLHHHLTGTLNIAMFDKLATNPNAHMGEVFRQFDDKAPKVSLNLYVDFLNEIERGVMEDKYQIGIIPEHRESSSLKYTYLFDEQMILYAGKGHPLFEMDGELINNEMILKQRYAGLGYHSPNMEVARDLKLKRAVTVYDQEAIVHLLASGRYLGFLPDHYARSFVEAGQIRAINNERFRYRCEFYAIHRASPKPSRIVQEFMNCLEKAHQTP